MAESDIVLIYVDEGENMLAPKSCPANILLLNSPRSVFLNTILLI